MRNIKLLSVSFLITFLSTLFFAGCDTDRFEIIEIKCGKCHDASIVLEKKRPFGDWERIVFGMKARGLTLTEAEEEEIMRILKNSLSME